MPAPLLISVKPTIVLIVPFQRSAAGAFLINKPTNAIKAIRMAGLRNKLNKEVQDRLNNYHFFSSTLPSILVGTYHAHSIFVYKAKKKSHLLHR